MKILVFGGTSEGRKIAEFLSNNEVQFTLSVATEYGAEMVADLPNMTVNSKRLNEDEILKAVLKYNYVIDATHPYAEEISKNIKKACDLTGKPLMRVSRDDTNDRTSCFSSIDKAVEYLNSTEGNIFITTGSKEIIKYKNIENAEERLFARVLPSVEAIELCKNAGVKSSHIICMQGPFSEEINLAMLKETKAQYLVTKSSGTAGGFQEKINAAEKLGVKSIIIGRPRENSGIPLDEAIKELCDIIDTKRKIYLIGIGAGVGDLTEKAQNTLKTVDIIIGAERVIDSLEEFNVPKKCEYRAEKIAEFLQKNKKYRNIALVYSGDIGFFSGAESISEDAFTDFKIERICGISSLQTLCARMGMSWSDVKCITMHGRNADIPTELLKYGKLFVLAEKGTVNKVCQDLVYSNMRDTAVIVGERLSYADERVVKGTAYTLLEEEFDGLSCMLIYDEKIMKSIEENKNKSYSSGIADSNFIRGSVPMTKSEIRAVLMSKLKIEKNDIIYDIGAGTGSVSVEMALRADEGKVYAIDKNPESIVLVNANRDEFGCRNIKTIEGNAEEVIDTLPDPDCVFIGGSMGHTAEILEKIKAKNKDCFVALNTVTAEGFANAITALKNLKAQNINITGVSVSRSREVGNSHLMMAENPVSIITAEGFLWEE